MLLRRVGVVDEPPGCVPLGARAVRGNIAGHVALRQQHGGHELAGELRKPEQGSAAFEESISYALTEVQVHTKCQRLPPR